MMPAALGVVLLALAARTYARNADWVDQGRFWRSAADAAPGRYKTNQAAANNAVYLTQQDWDRAVAETDRALAILDKLPDVQNVAMAYQHAGGSTGIWASGWRPRRRVRRARRSPRVGIGSHWMPLLRSEKIELAQDEVNRAENAKRGKPGLTFVSSALYLHLGRTYQKLKDPAHAIQAFERGRALESDPDLLEDLATEYCAAGERRPAAQALVEALAVESNRTQLMSKLLELCSEVDPQGCSVSHEGGSSGLNAECPMIHSDICMASRNVAQSYVRSGQLEHAASIRKTVTQDLGCAPELVK